MTEAEIAAAVGVDARTIRRDLDRVLAMLSRELPDLGELLVGDPATAVRTLELAFSRVRFSDTRAHGDQDSRRGPPGSISGPDQRGVPPARVAYPRRKILTVKLDATLATQLDDLNARVLMTDADLTRLQAAAVAGGDAQRFRDELRRVEAVSPARGPGDELDALERHRNNPFLKSMMRAVGLTAAQVREHGPRGGVVVVGNLAELVAATEARGE
jgi:hypothetical protein